MNWNFDGYQELYEDDLQRINGGYGDAGVCTTATGDTTIYTQTETVVHTPNTPEPIYTQTETVVHTPDTTIYTQTESPTHKYPNTPDAPPTAQSMPNVAASVNGSTWGTVAQKCTDLKADHCDIIAQNLAIAAGLTNTAPANLNGMLVKDVYKAYESSAVQPTKEGFVGTGSTVRGYVFFDWGGKSSPDGAMDHMEYCEISADGKSYKLYRNQGGTPTDDFEPYWSTLEFAKDPNGDRVSDSSTMKFVRLG